MHEKFSLHLSSAKINTLTQNHVSRLTAKEVLLCSWFQITSFSKYLSWSLTPFIKSYCWLGKGSVSWLICWKCDLIIVTSLELRLRSFYHVVFSKNLRDSAWGKINLTQKFISCSLIDNDPVGWRPLVWLRWVYKSWLVESLWYVLRTQNLTDVWSDVTRATFTLVPVNEYMTCCGQFWSLILWDQKTAAVFSLPLLFYYHAWWWFYYLRQTASLHNFTGFLKFSILFQKLNKCKRHVFHFLAEFRIELPLIRIKRSSRFLASWINFSIRILYFCY